MSRTRLKAQREPLRHRYATVAAVLITLGVLLSLTLIGAVLGIPLILVGAVFIVIRARVKTVSVSCGSCGVANTIEPKVQYFNCAQCNHTNA